jgi:arylsulfatase A-like enzyme
MMHTSKRVLWHVLVLAACLFAARAQEAPEGAAPAADAAPARPNFVVVVIDDLGKEDLTSVPVPNIDALVARGRNYASFYVHPSCTPSRYALQFGRQGMRDGVWRVLAANKRSMPGARKDRRSIGSALHDAGYATALFGKWHLSSVAEFEGLAGPGSLADSARAFGYEHWLAGNPSNLSRLPEHDHRNWERCDDGVVRLSKEYASAAVVDAFVEWWKVDEERPRFAVVNLFAPHTPYTHPPKELIASGHEFPATLRESYENCVVAVDTLIGRLAAAIDTSNTYLLVLSDNGTPQNDWPEGALSRGYKHTVWQGGVNVPFVVVGPGVVQGASNHLVHVVDVPATLLELCGAPAEASFQDSVSFAASLTGDAPPRPPVFVSGQRHKYESPLVTAVIDAEGWKLVDTTTEQFLFDLSKDPYETNPIDDPERTAALLDVARSVGGVIFERRRERLKAALERADRANDEDAPETDD